MELKILLVMSLIGGISSGIGGIIASIIKIKNNNTLGMLYQITGGIMTSIVCFDMLPECFEMSSILFVLFFTFFGIIIIYNIDKLIEKKNVLKNEYSNTTIIIMLLMTFHNFIEGLAIGASFSYSISIGVTLLISIVLHDIPEGMVVGITNKIDRKNFSKILINTVFSGVVTGIGAMFGYMIGGIDIKYICLCISFAAGAMLYIVSCELLPNAYNVTKNQKVYLMYILGILIGGVITKI